MGIYRNTRDGVQDMLGVIVFGKTSLRIDDLFEMAIYLVLES